MTNNVSVRTFGAGADQIPPMAIDLAKVRGEKLIQWEKDTVEIGKMGGLGARTGMSVLLSLLLNEMVRIAQFCGLSRKDLDEKIDYVWNNLPGVQKEMEEAADDAEATDDSDDDDKSVPLPIG